jgi:hypothetical protein
MTIDNFDSNLFESNYARSRHECTFFSDIVRLNDM